MKYNHIVLYSSQQHTMFASPLNIMELSIAAKKSNDVIRAVASYSSDMATILRRQAETLDEKAKVFQTYADNNDKLSKMSDELYTVNTHILTALDEEMFAGMEVRKYVLEKLAELNEIDEKSKLMYFRYNADKSKDISFEEERKLDKKVRDTIMEYNILYGKLESLFNGVNRLCITKIDAWKAHAYDLKNKEADTEASASEMSINEVNDNIGSVDISVTNVHIDVPGPIPTDNSTSG